MAVNTFFSNMFGSIFGNRLSGSKSPVPDFVPDGNSGEVIDIRGDEAQWLGLENANMQFYAYLYCAPLAAVIDRSAEADINAELKVLKNNNTDDYATSRVAKDFLRRLMNPNPMQTFEEFRGQQVVYKKIFGYCPVFVYVPTGFQKIDFEYCWNLNPFYWRPVYNNNFSLYKNKPIIEAWTCSMFGIEYTISSDKVMLLKDGYVDNYLREGALPMSKIAGLDFAVSNICAAMEADNVLLRKKGPLGIFSHDPKPDNVSGYVPMDESEKKEIQASLQQYGLSWDKFQYVISKMPLKWNPMSFNVRDLMTKETTRQGIDMICDRFAFPAELMSGKNATYENRSSAEKFFYQQNIIPSACRDMRHYNNYYETADYDFKLKLDYDDVAVLQKESKAAAEANKSNSEALDIQYKSGIITKNQYLVGLGQDTVPDGNTYYVEPTKITNNEVPPKNT